MGHFPFSFINPSTRVEKTHGLFLPRADNFSPPERCLRCISESNNKKFITYKAPQPSSSSLTRHRHFETFTWKHHRSWNLIEMLKLCLLPRSNTAETTKPVGQLFPFGQVCAERAIRARGRGAALHARLSPEPPSLRDNPGSSRREDAVCASALGSDTERGAKTQPVHPIPHL